MGDPSWGSEILEQVLRRLRTWAHGKLPQWARRRMETGDIVQEAIIGALEHLPEDEIRRPGALEAYVRRSIRNRIVDEVRRAQLVEVAGGASQQRVPDPEAGPFELAAVSEDRRRFSAAVLRLRESEQILVVGRVDLGLSYERLAVATGRSVAATRVATRRAVLKAARIAGDLMS